EIGERGEQLLLSRSHINAEYAIVGRVLDFAGPVKRADIAGHAPQPGHAAIVDRQELAAALGDAAVSDGRIFEAVLLDPVALLSAADIKEHAEDFARFWIAVVEEKLGFGLLGIPIEHRP